MDRIPSVTSTAAFLLVAAVAGDVLRAQPFVLDPPAASTSYPAVAAQPGGGFVVAWTRDRRIPLAFGPDAFVPQAVMWKRLRTNGSAAGPTRVAGDAGPTGIVQMPQLAADDLGAEVVWGRPAASGFRIDGRRVDPVTPGATLVACADGRLRGLRLLPSGSGSWLIWNESCDGLRIVGQRLDGRGRPTRTARILVGPAALPGNGFDFATVPGRGLVGAWSQRAPVEADEARFLVARAFRPDGRPRGASFRVGTATTEVAVAGLDNGDIWVAWRANGPLLVRAFHEDGVPLGPEQPAGEVEGAAERMPRWSNVVDDRAVLVWQRAQASLAPECVARRFGRHGAIGGELAVAERCVTPAVAQSNGRSLVVWQEPGANPDDSAAWRALARSLAPGDW